ncbi:RidA family protein [Marispirochaeta aestuarii]|uniref:RidA family protein n=1 Tax=Marispirochaeta aestuarii TaxID=1963862 RepID=UPI0029C98420|nr:RidA family protein [Marispirochaeta aestuarii]
MTFINTDKAPAAVGPYSQAVLSGKTLYVSGQIPFVPDTMTLVSEKVEEQAKQSLANIQAIIEAAGFVLTDVVKCTVFLTDMNDFAAVNTVYADFFGDHKPARCAVEVSRLPKDVQVEIDAVCEKN